MRLTIRNSDGTVSQPTNLDWAAALEKLAAYEDMELTPEEFHESVAFVLELNKKLKPYMDAEEQGLLVRLPCNVGDTLYEIDLPEYGVIVCNVLYVDIYNGPFAHVPGSKIVAAVSVGVEVVGGHGKGSSYAFEQDDFGKTVFLTREEAEAALKGGHDDGTA